MREGFDGTETYVEECKKQIDNINLTFDKKRKQYQEDKVDKNNVENYFEFILSTLSHKNKNKSDEGKGGK